MFKQEKDMIPVLRDKLSVIYNTNYFIEEFRSGNGIVDLAFTTNYKNNRNGLENFDFETIYFISNLLNRKNKKITQETLFFKTSLPKKRIEYLLKSLVEQDYLAKKNEHYTVEQTYNSILADLISVEAKIKDWKKGLHQALRYKYFSNLSFLAISEEYIHRVKLELLRNNEVGLISVSKNDIKIIYRPTKKSPANIISYNYLCEYFFSLLSATSQRVFV